MRNACPVGNKRKIDMVARNILTNMILLIIYVTISYDSLSPFFCIYKVSGSSGALIQDSEPPIIDWWDVLLERGSNPPCFFAPTGRTLVGIIPTGICLVIFVW